MDYSKAIDCAILCQDIYQEFAGIKFQILSETQPILLNKPDTDTQCAILQSTDGSKAWIVFRGSEKKLDWETNFNFRQIQFEFQQQVIQDKIVDKKTQVYPYAGSSSSGALMHCGFTTAYDSVREDIHKTLRESGIKTVIVTGHSLGGALATLCAVDIQFNFPEIAVEVYTFGAPRVGNTGFRDSFDRRVPNSYRFVNGMDIVPALPRYWQGYRHVSSEQRLGQRFNIQFISRRIKDHAIADYIENLKAAAGL